MINGRLGVDTYTRKSENSSLTLSQMSPKNLPSPWWEGMKGRGDGGIGFEKASDQIYN